MDIQLQLDSFVADSLGLAMSPNLWITVTIALFAGYWIAHITGKARVRRAQDPVKAARSTWLWTFLIVGTLTAAGAFVFFPGQELAGAALLLSATALLPLLMLPVTSAARSRS